MGKGVLFKALEELESEIEDDKIEPITEDNIDAVMLTLMEDEAEINDTINEVEEAQEKDDEIESSIERLEALCGVIRKYGISAPIMEAADPYRELVAAGICKAYEELEETAVKDEESEAVADKIEEATEAVVAPFLIRVAIGNVIGKLIGELLGKALLYVVNLQGALGSMDKTLSKLGTIDDEKFKATSVFAYDYDTFVKAANAGKQFMIKAQPNTILNFVNELANVITRDRPDQDRIDDVDRKIKALVDSVVNVPNVKDIFGFEVKTKGETEVIVDITKNQPELRKKQTVGELGWEFNNLKGGVRTALDIVRLGNRYFGEAEKAYKKAENILKTLDKNIKIDNKAAANKAVMSHCKKSIRLVFDIQHDLIVLGMRAVRDVSTSVLQVAKAAVKSKVKA
jgi:hypothetical protein